MHATFRDDSLHIFLLVPCPMLIALQVHPCPNLVACTSTLTAVTKHWSTGSDLLAKAVEHPGLLCAEVVCWSKAGCLAVSSMLRSCILGCWHVVLCSTCTCLLLKLRHLCCNAILCTNSLHATCLKVPLLGLGMFDHHYPLHAHMQGHAHPLHRRKHARACRHMCMCTPSPSSSPLYSDATGL